MRQEWLNIWMDLSEAARGPSTSSVVPIFHKRGIRGGGLASMATTKVTRVSPTTLPNRERIIMVAFNVPIIKVFIHLRIQTWKNMVGTTTWRNRISGCPVSVTSTSSQPGPLESVALNSPCCFPWMPGSKVKGNPWHMSVPKKYFSHWEWICWSMTYLEEIHIDWIW